MNFYIYTVVSEKHGRPPNASTNAAYVLHREGAILVVRLHALPCYIHFYLYGSLTPSPFVPPNALLYTLIVIADFMYQLRGSAMILKDILDGEIDVTVPCTRNTCLFAKSRGNVTIRGRTQHDSPAYEQNIGSR